MNLLNNTKRCFSAEIWAEALKIAKEKQKIIMQIGIPITATVKTEQMKATIAEARKATKNILAQSSDRLIFLEATNTCDLKQF
jgi:hypothetical protein